MTDYVPCVGILVVPSCQMTAVIFDIFSIFQLLFLTNCYFKSLFQGFNLSFSVSGWLNGPMVQETPFAVIFASFSVHNHLFSSVISSSNSQSEFLYFLGSIGSKNYQFLSCNRILMDQTTQNCLSYGRISISEFMFFQSSGIHFFFNSLNRELFVCFGFFCIFSIFLS